jgi:prolyl 4-hydroxylase
MTNFIGEYDFGEESTKELLSYFKGNIDLASPGKTIKDGVSIVDLNKKDSLDLSININDGGPLLENYKKKLSEALTKYKEEFVYCNEKQHFWGIREKVQLQYYKPGGGFKIFHCENQGSSLKEIQRHLVFMTYLNTIPPEEGGGTEFFYQGSYNAIAGKTLIWPAAWTHTHRGIISTTHEKFIITGWYSYSLVEF